MYGTQIVVLVHQSPVHDAYIWKEGPVCINTIFWRAMLHVAAGLLSSLLIPLPVCTIGTRFPSKNGKPSYQVPSTWYQGTVLRVLAGQVVQSLKSHQSSL